MSQIIHIISDYRSGSTLLDQLLGAHPRITSTGELHHLRAYVTQNRTLHDPVYPLACSCGLNVVDCDFWNDVDERLGTSLANLRLSPRFTTPRPRYQGIVGIAQARLRRIAEKALLNQPNGADRLFFGAARTVTDNCRLYDAIAAVTNATHIVDSSKSIPRCNIVASSRPENHRIVLLCRDFRAVVFSKMQRGRDLSQSARSWAEIVWQMETLASQHADRHVYRLRYEDLCSDPKTEMQRICDFLCVEYDTMMLSRPVANVHQIGGSPSKLQAEKREIKLDTAYLDALNERDITRMKEIVGSAANIWGYE